MNKPHPAAELLLVKARPHLGQDHAFEGGLQAQIGQGLDCRGDDAEMRRNRLRRCAQRFAALADGSSHVERDFERGGEPSKPAKGSFAL